MPSWPVCMPILSCRVWSGGSTVDVDELGSCRWVTALSRSTAIRQISVAWPAKRSGRPPATMYWSFIVSTWSRCHVRSGYTQKRTFVQMYCASETSVLERCHLSRLPCGIATAYTPFTRSSKRPANVFKIHVLIAWRLLDVCWKFVGSLRLHDRAFIQLAGRSMVIRRAGGL